MKQDLLLDVLEHHVGRPVGRIIHSDRGMEQKFHCPWDPPGKRPAFSINLETGLSFCFRCHKGWTLPQLLRDLGAPRRVREAASSLVEESFVDKDELKLVAPGVIPLPESLLGVFDPEGMPEYRWVYLPLVKSGFTSSILRQYEVGWDNRKQRFTYPMRDLQGQLIGIVGGDATGGQEPKYLLYNKDHLRDLLPDVKLGSVPEKKYFLWNADRVWMNGYRGMCGDDIIIVEGFKAALWLLQNGYHMVVALMGSYMSKWQANALMHMANRKILFLDHDEAGINGTKKANKLVRSMGGQPFRVVEYPKRLQHNPAQPDDCQFGELATMFRRNNG